MRRCKVVSEHGEHGEPMTWQSTSRLAEDDVVHLCRCGGSADRPFCDDTHNTNGFAGPPGAQPAPATGYARRARVMDGAGVVVRDDRSLCVHAGFCTNANVEPELAVQVAFMDDGPLLVTGRIAITRPDGTTDEVRNRVALCRCGESANKPYCDGAHATAGFSHS